MFRNLFDPPTSSKNVMQASASKKPEGKTHGQQAMMVDHKKAAEVASPQPKHSPKRAPRPKVLHPLEILLGEVVIDAKGHAISPKAFDVDDGVIGLYFAAHWCPPCRVFCPILMNVHKELRMKQEFFEVIYIGMDNSENSFREYLAKMPWFAVPFSAEERREEIADNFGIKGIPVLVLLDSKTLEIITFNGREILNRDHKGALFPWKNLPSESTKVSITSSKKTSDSSGRSGSIKGRSRRSSSERRRKSEQQQQADHTAAARASTGPSAPALGALTEHEKHVDAP